MIYKYVITHLTKKTIRSITTYKLHLIIGYESTKLQITFNYSFYRNGTMNQKGKL